MDPEKAAFLFPHLAPGTDLDDPGAVEGLLDATDDERVDGIVLRQVRDETPPQVWATAQRLLGAGMSRDEVLGQLTLSLLPLVLDALDEDGGIAEPYRIEDHVALLDRLPLPTTDQVTDVLVEIVRAGQPIPSGELEALAAERLGVPQGDPVVEAMIHRVEDDLSDVGGPFAMLHPDLFVHTASFTDGVVLTHRLTERERATGVLEVEVDLAPFAQRPFPRLPDDSALDETVTDDGISGWAGPPGWLDGVDAGRLLAVRTDLDGVVSIEPLDTAPEASEHLVALVREAYDDATTESLLPGSALDLVLGVLARDRTAFAAPAAPVVELAEAAGLERRGRDFGHAEIVWETAAEFALMVRVQDRLGTGEPSRIALWALDCLADDMTEPAELREVLDALDDPELLVTVTDELLGPDEDPARLPDATAAAGRLTAAATRPRQRAVACLLSATVAERAERPAEAEEHVREAFRADPDWAPAVDRLAWYRSDRGDAAGAVELLRRFEESDDLHVLERFVRPAGPVLGRNERCWCGSGRKYKACHLGRPATAPLPDRVGWLFHKAVMFLVHRGGLVEHDVALYADAAGRDVGDPLVDDVLLAEGGWFERFLIERGPLLPDDEALLAASWTLVPRTVYEIETITAETVRVRDQRTGDRIDVRERVLGHVTRETQLVCGRVVPDGEGHQFVGDVFTVPPGTERDLLGVLDDGDGLELLAHVAELGRPPDV